ncbi:MAG: hypothetical protein JNL24_14580 [Bacteroidia bacterium]|nr:hypothetical protein [Bacteroidia bacterium]
MIVNDFNVNFNMYENMAIWQIANLDDFFKSHEMLEEIFKKEYGFPFNERIEEKNNFIDKDIEVTSKLLDYFGDKYFLVFTNKDSSHNILKELQDKKIINFGMDIYVLHPDKVYVLEMDKTKDLQKYDKI